ncbi:hypothetical protein BDW74DRAFT_87783 [Aspergillus multicolor]|uniref:uncharacterized protein n=1 Tax=Aspergillus multicolor TaxID=41759 RepID=UPI003CCCEA91
MLQALIEAKWTRHVAERKKALVKPKAPTKQQTTSWITRLSTRAVSCTLSASGAKIIKAKGIRDVLLLLHHHRLTGVQEANAVPSDWWTVISSHAQPPYAVQIANKARCWGVNPGAAVFHLAVFISNPGLGAVNGADQQVKGMLVYKSTFHSLDARLVAEVRRDGCGASRYPVQHSRLSAKITNDIYPNLQLQSTTE